MATIQIDKLLETVVKEGASDLHLTTGQPPCVRRHGRLVRLETKVLGPEDTTSLMKSITPERNQQELQEVGGTDFGFAYGEKARFRVAIFKQRGHIAMVLAADPARVPDIRAARTADGRQGRDHAAARSVPGDGSDRQRQDDQPGQHDQLDQSKPRPPHHHDRRPDRVLPHAQEIDDQPAGGRGRRPQLPGSASPGAADGSRRDPRGGDAGPGNDLCGHHGGGDGPVVFATLHTTGAQGTVDRIIDVFPTEQQEQIRTQLSTSIIGILSQALLPRKPKGLVAAYEMLVVTPAIANLIRENKTYRINSSIQTGRKFGMQLLDDALFNLWKNGLCEEQDIVMKSNHPGELKARLERAKRGLFDEEDEESGEGEETKDDDD